MIHEEEPMFSEDQLERLKRLRTAIEEGCVHEQTFESQRLIFARSLYERRITNEGTEEGEPVTTEAVIAAHGVADDSEVMTDRRIQYELERKNKKNMFQQRKREFQAWLVANNRINTRDEGEKIEDEKLVDLEKLNGKTVSNGEPIVVTNNISTGEEIIYEILTDVYEKRQGFDVSDPIIQDPNKNDEYGISMIE